MAHYNGSFLNGAGASLRGPGPWGGEAITIVPNVIAGNYSALIQCGFPLFHPTQPSPSSASLAQIGLVSSGTHSLFLSIDAHVPFSVSLGGQSLGLVPVQQSSTYTVFGADVTSFANQDAELRITTAALGFGYLWVDSINFSPIPVPEPNVIALVAVAGLLFALKLVRLRRPAQRHASTPLG